MVKWLNCLALKGTINFQEIVPRRGRIGIQSDANRIQLERGTIDGVRLFSAMVV